MRQAVLSVPSEAVADFGFAVFQGAGLRDIDILSCEGSSGVSRIHLQEEPDEHRLDEIDTIQWWEEVATDDSEYVYLVRDGHRQSVRAEGRRRRGNPPG